tara:strand:+ start:43 stop:714 length:672 start_codon:yes stop_codon:yes gene_type:complete
MLGDIVQGATQFGMSFIGNKDRKARIADAEGLLKQSRNAYFNQDTSNLYSNLENTMEDLTVNQGAARFQMEQQAQGQANIMSNLRGAAGSSGVAGLAQALANQQAQSARQASIDIGRQEQGNQMAAAGQAGRLQAMERGGAAQARSLKSDLLGQELQIDANELSQSRQAQQQALAMRAQGLGQLAGGVTDALAVGFTGGMGSFKKNIGAGIKADLGYEDAFKQ